MEDVSYLALEFVNRYNLKKERKLLENCKTAIKFTLLEMAYFCQQVVSYTTDSAEASMMLTVFSNYLSCM